MAMTMRVEDVGPGAAQEMLKRNKKNRHLRPGLVKKYAADMAAGDWKLNGEPLIFDSDGNLNDGQHRLNGVIESGMTVPFLVVRGVSPDVLPTIDGGVSRTVADRLSFDGHGNVTVLASRGVVLLTLERGEKSRTAATLAQIKGALNRHAEGMAWVTGFLPNGRGFGHSAIAGTLAYCYPTDRAAVIEFSEKLREGVGLQKGDPAYHLREWVFNNPERVGAKGMLFAAGVLRALWSHMNNERVYLARPGQVLEGELWGRMLEFFGRVHQSPPT